MSKLPAEILGLAGREEQAAGEHEIGRGSRGDGARARSAARAEPVGDAEKRESVVGRDGAHFARGLFLHCARPILARVVAIFNKLFSARNKPPETGPELWVIHHKFIMMC